MNWTKIKNAEPKIGDYYYVKIDTKQDSILKTICEWAKYPNGNYDWDFEGIQHFSGLKEEAEVIEWLDEEENIVTMLDLMELLAQHGGTIESTASLKPNDIEQARASGRMYVDQWSLGYVWMPNIKRMPITDKEIELFEKWFPLDIELPEELKTLDWYFKREGKKENEKAD
jgi:hypothetical protein